MLEPSSLIKGWDFVLLRKCCLLLRYENADKATLDLIVPQVATQIQRQNIRNSKTKYKKTKTVSLSATTQFNESLYCKI